MRVVRDVRMSRHGGLRFLRYRRADPAAKPRMLLAACARKPTNYFRVYKINERSVADGTGVPSRSLCFYIARERTRRVRDQEEKEKEREREENVPWRISKCFPRGRCRLCFLQQWSGPAQVLLTEPPRSTECSPDM